LKPRGRAPEPDQAARQLEIAARVYRYKKLNDVSLNDARRAIAEQLGCSEDTVRRAWRRWRGKGRVITGAMHLEIQFDANPDAAARKFTALRTRIAEVKKNRGKI
jgi:hypothetical protein